MLMEKHISLPWYTSFAYYMRKGRGHGTVGMGEYVCVQSRSRGRVQRVTLQ